MSPENLDFPLSEDIVFVKLIFDNRHYYELFIILRLYCKFIRYISIFYSKSFFTCFYQKLLLFYKNVFEHYTVRNARKSTKNTFMYFYILKILEKLLNFQDKKTKKNFSILWSSAKFS